MFRELNLNSLDGSNSGRSKGIVGLQIRLADGMDFEVQFATGACFRQCKVRHPINGGI